MRLDMKTRKSICGKIYKRYQRAGKKEKGAILDEYAAMLDLNRDYLAHLLAHWGKNCYAQSGGKLVKYTAKPPVKGRRKAPGGAKAGRPEKYHKAFVRALTAVWELFDFPCGKLLAPLIKSAIGFLALEFSPVKEFAALFESVSSSTIDRKLGPQKKRLRIKGISTTKKGTLLKSQIPIRVCFDRGERTPGFFQADTVSIAEHVLQDSFARP